ncbi:oxaloacetate decarboxylase subunit alpha [Mycoplasmatota bacterium WC44]
MVKITETALRDGHQSLIATRLKTDEILEIVEKMDQVGYHALEVWGGATFDSCLRFLNEDPWERLRQIRKRVKNTKLQMLLRGQNILGYKHYPDDIVEMFVKKAIENGIDIIRIFDALNDVRNLKTAVDATKKYGGHCQIAISYTISSVHTIDYYVNLSVELVKMGADSICIKDMAGVLLPYDAYELVTKMKEKLSVPIELHSHQTSGTASMTYLKAIEAGVDIIDTAISPLSGGTSQPATESIFYSLENTKHNLNLNKDILDEVTEYFIDVRNKYLNEGILNPKALMTNPNILKYQVPGGMLSNLMSQLESQGASDKYELVLKEVPRVRADLGYPPLVTPMSQMVGTQAVMNVLTNQRYKVIPTEIKDYVKGLYGKPPVKISDEIRKLIIGDENVIDYRPADDLKPMFEEVKNKYKDIVLTDEDVLSCALFPQTAVDYLSGDVDEVIEFILLAE